MTKILIALVLTTICSYGQFQPNSVGVVYLTDESFDSYHVTILFPIQSLIKSDATPTGDFEKIIGQFEFNGELALFDDRGDLLILRQNAEFKIKFWCENDGGIQYRPSFDTTIKKSKFKRKIQGIKEIQNIACFVIANRTVSKVGQTVNKQSSNAKLKGDSNNDGQIDCLLLTYSGEDCEGEPKNNLGLILQIREKEFSLRCCGP